MFQGHITDIQGIAAGHAQHEAARTGCTVVLCPQGAVAGVDVRGAAPGTRETDLLKPGNLVEKVHAILLTGGSAFGLAAADGVMRWLYEHHAGHTVGKHIVPIVPAAVLFDLDCGDGSVWPDADMGYLACCQAGKDAAQGRIGAGTGAMVGKVLGMDYASPGGIGSASIRLPSGATVGAIAAVNAMGDVRHIHEGHIIAGAHRPDGQGFINTSEFLLSSKMPVHTAGSNTTIAVVATDAALSCEQANRLATIAHDGYARAIFPVHTQYDGDTIFSLATGFMQEDMTILLNAASEVMARAIVNAVLY